MKRNILVSLMIIGAVAALISGATFSAFNDTETVDGTVSAGTVTVDLSPTGEGGLTWTPCAEDNLGSEEECTSTVAVDYTGSLAANLDFALTITDTGSCFQVSMAWAGGSAVTTPAPMVLGPVTAVDDDLVITVLIDPSLLSDQEALNACQGADLILSLLVTATEDVS